MNNDPFTAAARAEAERDHPDDDYEGSGGAERCAFMAGAVWARTHLAAQEPTDAETEAAANALAD